MSDFQAYRLIFTETRRSYCGLGGNAEERAKAEGRGILIAFA